MTMAEAATRVPLRAAFATRALQQCQLAAATSRVIDTVMLVAVSVVLFNRAGAAAVALYGVVTTLGPAVGTPLVGAVAGRLRPGTALASCLGGAGLALGVCTAVIAADGPVAAILATVVVAAVLTASIRPTVSSLLPSFLRSPAELVATNAAAAGVESVSAILGPLLAAAGLALADPATVLGGAVVVLLSAAAATVSLDSVVMPLTSPSRIGAEVLGGLRTIVQRGPVRLITFLVGSQAFGRGALNVVAVSLAIDRLGLTESGVGVLLGAIGVGGLVGLPVAAVVAGRGRHGRNLLGGLAVWALPLAGLGLTTVDPVVLVLLGVAGVGNTVLDISTDSLLQRLAPRGRLSALLGSFEAVLFLTKAAGATAAGVLLVVAGPVPAVIVIGTLPLLFIAAGATRTRRLDDEIRDRDAGLALLRTNGIFSPLVLAAVDQLSSAAVVEEFERGEEILVEGEVGDRYYVIDSGEVDVVRNGSVIDQMSAGDGFGEVALLDGRPRNATIVARTSVTTRSLDGESFLEAMHAGPTSRAEAERIADERRHDDEPDGRTRGA